MDATHDSPRLQPIYSLHSFYRFTLQVNLGDKSGGV